MIDQAPFSRAGNIEQQAVMDLANKIRAVVAASSDDPRDQAAIGMTACGVVAGYLYGMMVAIGVESGTSNRTKRAAKMVDTNFRAGLKIALNMAAKTAQEQGVH